MRSEINVNKKFKNQRLRIKKKINQDFKILVRLLKNPNQKEKDDKNSKIKQFN